MNITFKQYLKEETPSGILQKISDPDIKEFFETLFEIADNIKPFVKAIGGPKNLSKKIMWRGIKNNGEIIRTIRKNRKPSDTEVNTSKVIDDWFLKNFKTRFRSNAIFVVGREGLAMNFGIPAAILPKGNFSFVWSPKVSDLFKKNLFRLKTKLSVSSQLSPVEPNDQKILHDLSNISIDKKDIKFVLDMNNFLNDNKTIKLAVNEVIKSIQAGLDGAEYQNTNLDKAIKTPNEIMISGNEYYIISDEIGIFKNIKTTLIDEKIKEFLPTKIFKFDDEIFILKLIELILLGKITR